jgi:purine-binding chemotaxis protein CheW
MANNVQSEEVKQYVIFSLGKELYGIDIKKVTTIEKEKQYIITRVPKSSSFVKGVINLRGEIIPVIKLRKKFGMNEIEINEDTRI